VANSAAYNAGHAFGTVAFIIGVLAIGVYFGNRLARKRDDGIFVRWPVGVALAVVLLGLLGQCSAPSQAKTAAGHAAASRRGATTSRAAAPAVRVTGYAASKYIREPLPEQAEWMMVRTGAPEKDLSSWLPPTDPAYALLRKDPKLFATADVAINFDERGAPTSCSVKESKGDPILLDQLCDRILP
jgi:hypothetical protein